MAKVRDIERAEEDCPALVRFKQKNKRRDIKVEKATAAMVNELSTQNDKLSHQVLILSKLLRGVYRMLPANLKVEYEKLRDEIDALEGLDSDGV